MSEVIFAQQCLDTLGRLPLVTNADSVADPRRYPAQSAQILPKMSKPYTVSKPTATSTSSTPASPTGLNLIFKPLRAAASIPASISLPATPRNTSVYELKVEIARRTGYAPDKVKLLSSKRPVVDSKTVQEVVTEANVGEGQDLEMGIMFVGAPTLEPASDAALEGPSQIGAVKAGEVKQQDAPVAQGTSGDAVLRTEAFWDDLRGFVLQRVRDEGVTADLMKTFRGSWEASK